MPAQIGRFSGVALIRVLADRGSCAICEGLLSGVHSRKRTSGRPHIAIQYRRGTTRTGELDGAKEADGG
jgi:hypothetical protein